MQTIKLIAFDLDGTLTQHKSPLSPENRDVLYEEVLAFLRKQLEEVL